ncbi:glycoside hydrolase superfamily [Penicillium argentinense]|uniref:alpha-amylase n=1 Tax=Penicillium argentinense TaxID=1131581 RepID=A0A9W9EXT5_9EURO|nr:glycoside hydrolase superfamily [Penicillium argentinense]KAJ5089846.1 glycoside hydrolase superfamily [Penicillium argentinense]
MTDRFARTDGSTTSPCNTTAGLYCGGTWRGTIDRLDYIQGMGFDAVMISPIIENVEGRVYYGEAYHGYWPLNLYSLNAHFGTKQDLLDLSDAVHSRGMYLMMDTVINNMAYITNGSNPATNIDYSAFTPFNKADYFHPYCKITDWNNYTNAQLCQTGDKYVPLPDLFTEHQDVQTLLEDWAQETMHTYSIDGLRIDAAKHVSPGFLKNFDSSTDVFMTGEVLQREVSTVCDYQKKYIGSVPNYPIYFSMLEAFTKGNISDLAYKVIEMKTSCPDVTALVSFSENHDVERIASFNDDITLAKNILVFTILFDGIPMIYQGQEQHLKGSATPLNRQALWLSKYNTDSVLYKLIAKLNAIRKQAQKLDSDYVKIHSRAVFQGGSELAFVKGTEGLQVLLLLSNQGASGKPYSMTLPFSFNAGTHVTEVLNCKNYTVDSQGELQVDMDAGEPRVFYPTKYLEGSGLCGYSSANISLVELKTGYHAASSHGFTLHGSLKSTTWALLGLSSMIVIALAAI